MKVYSMYKDDGDWIIDSKPSSFDEADILVMPGGADVSPEIYKHQAISATYSSYKQDMIEIALMRKAFQQNKLIIGICKSSQMLTAIAGGSLIQDIRHMGRHKVKTFDGLELDVNSTHHQMSFPYEMPDDEYEVLAWGEQLSPRHIIQGEKQLEFPANSLDENGMFKEPEVIWYPKYKALAIQPHPENYGFPEETSKWLNNLILKYINHDKN